ncbi:MAG: glycosyltransferase family 2 protein [Euryarchaeota archaeon]|nr:glycosyltransferase family 2 protein [Euryarchaeota archaeon]
MYKGKTLGVVVPAYNEAGFVGRVIETVPSVVDRVYAIDDRSTDGTWAEIRETARKENERTTRPYAIANGGTDGGTTLFDEPVVALRNEENRGVGGTIKRGYAHALADGIEVVAVMNGDGQMDPANLDRIIDPVVEGGADFAKGNRLVGREFRKGMSPWRVFGNTVLTLLTKIASGYWKTMDPQNGYTAISANAIETVRFETLYEDYGFCNDLLISLNANNMRVADVAMPAVYGEESSTIVYSRFIPRLSRLLVRKFLWRINTKYLMSDFHPLAFLYYLGAGTLALAVGALAQAARPSRRSADPVGWVASSILFFCGFLSIIAAMILDMRTNEHLEERFHD